MFDECSKFQEAEVKELYHRYDAMKKLASQEEIKLDDIPEHVECEQLRALVTKHNKLNYRLGILKRVGSIIY